MSNSESDFGGLDVKLEGRELYRTGGFFDFNEIKWMINFRIGIVQNMFFSCALGSIIGVGLILLKRMNKDKPMAFGPYMIVAAVIQIYLPGLFNQLNPFLR